MNENNVPADDWRPFGLTVEAALNRGDDPAMLFDENSPIRDELRRLLAAPVAQPPATAEAVDCEACLGSSVRGFRRGVKCLACDGSGTATQPPAPVLCACKDRVAADCPGEWEPGCDLGNNAAHVKVSTVDPATIDAALAAPVQQTEAVAPTWGYAKTVGNAIAQLQTMDPALPFYAALHLQDGRCIARGVTFSRERVVNERWIDSANKDVPYSIVVWSQPVESLYATPPAPALPPVAMEERNHGLDTDDRVCFYEQDFYVLSNFSSFNLRRHGFDWPTSEHAYHGEKFRNLRGDICGLIARAPSAHEAFKIAERYRHNRRRDWDEVKVDIMRDILREKARQHEYVRRKLLATGDRELVENSWRDDYWGWGPNRDGQNMLGKLWMEVRAELRHAIEASTGEQSHG